MQKRVKSAQLIEVIQMKAFCLSSVLLCAAVLPMAARADTIQTFLFGGIYPDRGGSTAQGTASGNVVIDTTTGLIQSIDFTYSERGLGEFSIGTSQDNSGPNVFFSEALDRATNDKFTDFGIYLPTSSLVGYAGGVICSVANPCAANSFFMQSHFLPQYFLDGQLTPVPEPSGLVLLGTGCLGLVTAYCRKSRRREGTKVWADADSAA